MPSVAGGEWVVALPAWGDRAVDVLLRYTLPAAEIALRALNRPYKLMIWTDQPERMPYVETPAVGIMPVPGPDNAFESLSNCHRAALAAASPRDRVLLLTADMVLSRELLVTCEAQIMLGKRVVCCVAMRSLECAGPPVGVTGRELLEWAWVNRHPMTRECTWPEGTSYDIWRMYFEKDGEVAARVFLPHPLVVMTGGKRCVFSPTIDVNLAANFTRSQTHMVTDPDEGAVIEASPTAKAFLLSTTMRNRMSVNKDSCPTLTRATNPRHSMFFSKRVIIRGSGGDCGDAEVIKRVLGTGA